VYPQKERKLLIGFGISHRIVGQTPEAKAIFFGNHRKLFKFAKLSCKIEKFYFYFFVDFIYE
jgi:hypothetical protein